jgi:hypothetical protein
MRVHGGSRSAIGVATSADRNIITFLCQTRHGADRFRARLPPGRPELQEIQPAPGGVIPQSIWRTHSEIIHDNQAQAAQWQCPRPVVGSQTAPLIYAPKVARSSFHLFGEHRRE